MRLDELERELRAERPEPESDFARRLDDWAAAGFPRDRGLGPRAVRAAVPGAAVLRRVWERLAAVPPRRVLAPAGSLAVMVVVIGIAVSQSGDEGGVVTGGDRGSEDDSAASELESGDAGGGAIEKPAAPDQGAAPQALEDSAGADDAARADEAIAPAPVPPPGDGGAGGIARGAENRIVDATARVRLGADADEVQEVANGVVEITDRYDGVVSDSQVTGDQAGARAAFTLEIPYKQLDAALADLSGLADVISRTEAGEDITARAVRARKELAGLFDRIRAARVELIRADTREQRLIIKSRIRSLEASADAAEAALNNVKRAGRFATVSVEITSNHPGSDDGDWSLGDALDDAGRVVEVIGGIALVTLAVVVPLALVGALAWLIAVRARRAQRERALDE